MKKILLPILAALLLISGLPVAAAGTEAAALKLTGLDKKLTDGNHLTAAECGEIKLSADGEISSLYIIFHSKVQEFTIKSGEKTETVTSEFLHMLTDVSAFKSSELTQSTHYFGCHWLLRRVQW